MTARATLTGLQISARVFEYYSTSLLTLFGSSARARVHGAYRRWYQHVAGVLASTVASATLVPTLVPTMAIVWGHGARR